MSNEVEDAFTKTCKNYNEMGESLKVVSEILSLRVSDEDLKAFIAVMLQGESLPHSDAVAGSIADALRNNFILIVKPQQESCECDHPDHQNN